MRAIAILLCFFAWGAYASDFSKVVDSRFDDWNDNGNRDQIVMVKNIDDSSVDLYIYLDVGTQESSTIYVPKVAWIGGAWGQLPSLEVKTGTNSFLINSTQWAIGRHKWQLSVTVSFRNDQFVVSGWKYSGLDASGRGDDPEEPFVFACDVNLLSGDFEIYEGDLEKKGQVQPEPILLADFDMEFTPDICTKFFNGLNN